MTAFHVITCSADETARLHDLARRRAEELRTEAIRASWNWLGDRLRRRRPAASSEARHRPARGRDLLPET
jgi:hypothetical protein